MGCCRLQGQHDEPAHAGHERQKMIRNTVQVNCRAWTRTLRALLEAVAAMSLVSAHAAGPNPASAKASAKAPSKPRYTLSSGRGWAVCEQYVSFLNALPASENPPLCDMKFKRVPNMSEPDWEELDIAQHLPIVHQIELRLGISSITPDPLQDFEQWKQQRLARIAAQNQQPRLRRARMAMVLGGPQETVLSYDQDTKKCAKEVASMKRGEPYETDLGASTFFILDEAQQRVLGSGSSWLVDASGTLWNHLGRPYNFHLFVSGGIGSNYVNPGVLSANLYVKRLEPVLDIEHFRFKFPNNPLYRFHGLCEIKFSYPIERVRN